MPTYSLSFASAEASELKISLDKITCTDDTKRVRNRQAKDT